MSHTNEPSGRKKRWYSHVGNWYARFERPISSLSLIGGFVFDAVTLRRVDLFWENLWVAVHLIAVALCIFLINRGENARHASGHGETSAEREHYSPEEMHFWLINILQFFFGGLLSTFLVYYFRAGALAVSWPFLVILAAAFIANERLKRHYSRLTFQIGLLFLSVFSFAIFIVPVIVHAISPGVFLLSGIISLAVIGIFLLSLHIAARETFNRSRWLVFGVIAGIFAAINFLYFYNFIPPLPLSLKDGEIYHSLAVNGPGNYTVTGEAPQPWWRFSELYPPVHLVAGSPLYAYTAVFSPALFNLDVIHEWQHYDPGTHAWVTVSRVTLAVSGGRDGGYRTFSEDTPTAAGEWRVNVKTLNGAVIGRVNFAVVLASSTPPLQTTEIN